MARDDPMQPDYLKDGRPVRRDEQQRLLCSARRKDGSPCNSPAMLGGRVCRMHGGASPQARRKARLRLAELADPAIATLARIMADPETKTGDKLRAADSILDRAGYGRSQTIESSEARAILLERISALRAEHESQADPFEETPEGIEKEPEDGE